MTTDTLAGRFDDVLAKVRALPANSPMQLSSETKLALYGLYRQAKDGDAPAQKIGLFDIVARLKAEAWSRNKGMSGEEAMRRYLDLVLPLARQHGVNL
jgi:acyl-CoA-binding protein